MLFAWARRSSRRASTSTSRTSRRRTRSARTWASRSCPIAIGTFIAGWSSGYLVKTLRRGRQPERAAHVVVVGPTASSRPILMLALRPLRRAASGPRPERTAPMDYRDLATETPEDRPRRGRRRRRRVVAEGTEFSVTVRKGEVETLTEAGSKALGLRVFVGKRTASTYTSDFSWPTLARLIDGGGRRWRAPPARTRRRGCPTRWSRRRTSSSGSSTPRRSSCRPTERIERARRAEAAALEVPGIVNSQGASWGSGEGSMRARHERRLHGRLPHLVGLALGRARRPRATGRWSATTGTPPAAASPTSSRPSRSAAPPPSGRCGGSARAR